MRASESERMGSAALAILTECRETKMHTLQTFTACDLQAMEFPPINYVVPGYVPEGLTMLVGKPKLGKSWLALDWALAVACGGIACGSIACDAGDVLYAALEDNKRRLHRRIKMLLPNAKWPDRLELMTEMRRLNNGGLEDIKVWMSAVERPRLFIIDTFACIRPERQQKDSIYDGDYAALRPVQQLAGEFGVAIVVVHHASKREAEDPLDLASGSTGVTGAPDTVLVLTRGGQGPMLFGRGRDIDEIETAMLFDKATGRWTVMGNADEVRRSDQRQEILDALQAGGELTPAKIALATGQKSGNVRYLLHAMVKAGEVEKVAGNKSIYRVPQQP